MDADAQRERKIAGWFAEHGRRLLRFVRSKIADIEEAEDVAQDVWLQLTRLDTLDDIEQVGNWLFTAARNRVVNFYKKRKSVPFSQLEGLRGADGDDDDGGLADGLFFELWADDAMPGAAIESEEFWAAFNAALDRLPAEQRDVFTAHELDGIPFRELAELTGTNINTLMARKRYAVQRLQKELAGRGFEFWVSG